MWARGEEGMETTNNGRTGRREWGKGRKVFDLDALASKQTMGPFDPTAL
jgi:hypothetical protein